MIHARLFVAAAAGLLFGLFHGLGAASAQDKPAEAAAPPPAAIQNAPPDIIAPSMKAGQPNAETHKAPETVGQPPHASDPNVLDPKASDPKASDPKASDPKASDPKASDPKASDPKVSDPKASDGDKTRAVTPDANGGAGTKK